MTQQRIRPLIAFYL